MKRNIFINYLIILKNSLLRIGGINARFLPSFTSFQHKGFAPLYCPRYNIHNAYGISNIPIHIIHKGIRTEQNWVNRMDWKFNRFRTQKKRKCWDSFNKYIFGCVPGLSFVLDLRNMTIKEQRGLLSGSPESSKEERQSHASSCNTLY